MLQHMPTRYSNDFLRVMGEADEEAERRCGPVVDLRHGDCRAVLPTMAAGSVDAVVTDPPYGLSFMGKRWDYDVPSADTWREVLRVMKPGAHLLCFGGARTYHRVVCAIEDAGFEIRDCVMWVYGSGMPKGKAVLKPSHEPIVMARKPLEGTMAANIEKWGTGGLGIEGCRVGVSKNVPASVSRKAPANYYGSFREYGETPGVGGHDPNLGRWPANLIHDGSDEVLELFPEASGPDRRGNPDGRRPGGFGDVGADNGDTKPNAAVYADAGSAARFFYCAKASRKDRGAGNNHPTVKPQALMRYLARLVTPPGGLILDPFAGSGSTGLAALSEGFRFIGIEREVEYVEIARQRVAEVA